MYSNSRRRSRPWGGRPARMLALNGLNAGLLVDAQHHRVSRRDFVSLSGNTSLAERLQLATANSGGRLKLRIQEPDGPTLLYASGSHKAELKTPHRCIE